MYIDNKKYKEKLRVMQAQMFTTYNKCGTSYTNCYYSKEGEPKTLLA